MHTTSCSDKHNVEQTVQLKRVSVKQSQHRITAQPTQMLGDGERQEFDTWTGDQINGLQDIGKLKRAAAYYRQEGLLPTVIAVENRLAQLAGCHDKQIDSSDANDVTTVLQSFQEECKQKVNSFNTQREDVQQLRPPVRTSLKEGTTPSAAHNSRGSKAKAGLHSQDLTDQAFQDQEVPPLGGAALRTRAPAANTTKLNMPGQLRAHHQQLQQQHQEQLVQEVQLKGAKRTQQLIQQNQHLSPSERTAVAEQQRLKGNEFFRSGDTAEAVECYTQCIGLDPSQLAAYTNRAQAYITLKQWDYAITDCTSALTLIQQQEVAGTADEPLRGLQVKALVRRAKALESKKQFDRALQDYEEVLQLIPGDRDVQVMAAKARKGLETNTAATTAAAANRPSKTRIQVIEVVSDDDTDESEEHCSSATPSAHHAHAASTTTTNIASTKGGEQEHSNVAEVDRSQACSAAPAPSAHPSHEQQGASQLQQQCQQQAAVKVPILVVTDSDESDEETSAEEEQQQGQQCARMQPEQVHVQQHPDLASQPAVCLAAAACPAPCVAAAQTCEKTFVQEPPPPPATAAAPPSHGTSSSISMSHTSVREPGSSGSSSDDEASDSSYASDAESPGTLPGAAAAEPQVLPSFDDVLDTLCTEGNNAFKAGQHQQAYEAYSKALQLAPDSVRAYVNASLALMKLGRPRDAHETATLAIGLSHGNAKAFYARHKAKVALGDLKGAAADLSRVIVLEPPSRQQQYQQELVALEDKAAADAAAAMEAAERAQHASKTVTQSCTIEEVVDDPFEEQQRVFDDLSAQERMLTNRAKKLQQQAAVLRSEHESWVEQQKQQHQQHLQQQQQRREQRQLRRQAKEQQRQAAWASKVQARQQRLARKPHVSTTPSTTAPHAQAAPALDQLQPAADASVPLSQTPPAAEGRAVLAGPPTPPGSQHEDAAPAESGGVNILNPVPVTDGRGRPRSAAAAAAAALAREAASVMETLDTAAVAARAAAQEPSEETEVTAGPSTPRAELAPTPLTPACASSVAGSSAQAAAQQQQQQHTQLAQVSTAVHGSLCEQVEALRERGNQFMMNGQLHAAREAYMEALQLDPDHVKVLLNLAAVALQQRDGATALRSCDEVLCQEGTTEQLTTQLKHKALLRRGLALELLGHYEEALQHLCHVKQEAQAAADPQLSADMLRLAQLVQQSKQQQQQQQQGGLGGLQGGPHPDPLGASSRAAAAADPGDQLPHEAQLNGIEAAGSRAEEDGSSDNERTLTADDAEAWQPLLDGHGRATAAAAAATGDGSGGSDGSDGSDCISDGCSGCHMSSLPGSLTWDPYQPFVGDAVQKHNPVEHSNQHTSSASCSSDDSSLDNTLARLAAGDDMLLDDAAGTDMLWGDLLPGGGELEADRCLDGVDSFTQDLLKRHAELQALQGVDDLESSSQTAALLQRQRMQQQQQQQDTTDASRNLGRLQQLYEQHQQRKALKATETDKGSMAIQAGQWNAALRHYNAAIAASHGDAEAYAARSHVFVQLRRPAKAEEDCSTALQMLEQSGWQLGGSAADGMALRAKLLARRALARKELGRLREALTDAKELQGLCPADAAVQKLLAECTEAFKQHVQRLVLARQQEQQGSSTDTAAGSVMGTAASESGSSTCADDAVDMAAGADGVSPVVRLHRIPIEETDGSDSDEETFESDGFSSFGSGTAGNSNDSGSSDYDDASDDYDDASEEDEEEEEEEDDSSSEEEVVVAVAPAAVARSTTAASRRSASTTTTGSTMGQQQQQQLVAPKTSFAFMATAKALMAPAAAAASAVRGQGGGGAPHNQQQQQQQPEAEQQALQRLGEYVRLLPPAQYSVVFKSSLEPDTLRLLLQGLQQVAASEPDFARQGLEALCRVPRFGFIYAMAGKGIRPLAQEVVDCVAAAGRDVAAIKGSYSL